MVSVLSKLHEAIADAARESKIYIADTEEEPSFFARLWGKTKSPKEPKSLQKFKFFLGPVYAHSNHDLSCGQYYKAFRPYIVSELTKKIADQKDILKTFLATQQRLNEFREFITLKAKTIGKEKIDPEILRTLQGMVKTFELTKEKIKAEGFNKNKQQIESYSTPIAHLEKSIKDQYPDLPEASTEIAFTDEMKQEMRLFLELELEAAINEVCQGEIRAQALIFAARKKKELIDEFLKSKNFSVLKQILKDLTLKAKDELYRENRLLNLDHLNKQEQNRFEEKKYFDEMSSWIQINRNSSYFLSKELGVDEKRIKYKEQNSIPEFQQPEKPELDQAEVDKLFAAIKKIPGGVVREHFIRELSKHYLCSNSTQYEAGSLQSADLWFSRNGIWWGETETQRNSEINENEKKSLEEDIRIIRSVEKTKNTLLFLEEECEELVLESKILQSTTRAERDLCEYQYAAMKESHKKEFNFSYNDISNYLYKYNQKQSQKAFSGTLKTEAKPSTEKRDIIWLNEQFESTARIDEIQKRLEKVLKIKSWAEKNKTLRKQEREQINQQKNIEIFSREESWKSIYRYLKAFKPASEAQLILKEELTTRLLSRTEQIEKLRKEELNLFSFESVSILSHLVSEQQAINWVVRSILFYLYYASAQGKDEGCLFSGPNTPNGEMVGINQILEKINNDRTKQVPSDSIYDEGLASRAYEYFGDFLNGFLEKITKGEILYLSAEPQTSPKLTESESNVSYRHFLQLHNQFTSAPSAQPEAIVSLWQAYYDLIKAQREDHPLAQFLLLNKVDEEALNYELADKAYEQVEEQLKAYPEILAEVRRSQKPEEPISTTIPCVKQHNRYHLSVTQAQLATSPHGLLRFTDKDSGQEIALLQLINGNLSFKANENQNTDFTLNLEDPIAASVCILENPCQKIKLKGNIQSDQGLYLAAKSDSFTIEGNIEAQVLSLETNGNCQIAKQSTLEASTNALNIKAKSLALDGEIQAKGLMRVELNETLELSHQSCCLSEENLLITANALKINGQLAAKGGLKVEAKDSILFDGAARIFGLQALDLQTKNLMSQQKAIIYTEGSLKVTASNAINITKDNSWTSKVCSITTKRFDNYCANFEAEEAQIDANEFKHHLGSQINTKEKLNLIGDSAWIAGDIHYGKKLLVSMNRLFMQGLTDWDSVYERFELIKEKKFLAGTLKGQQAEINVGAYCNIGSSLEASSYTINGIAEFNAGATFSNSGSKSIFFSLDAGFELPSKDFLSNFKNAVFAVSKGNLREASSELTAGYSEDALKIKLANFLRWAIRMIFPAAAITVDFIYSVVMLILSTPRLYHAYLTLKAKYGSEEKIQPRDLYPLFGQANVLFNQCLSLEGQTQGLVAQGPDLLDNFLKFQPTTKPLPSLAMDFMALFAPMSMNSSLASFNAGFHLTGTRMDQSILSARMADLNIAFNQSQTFFAGVDETNLSIANNLSKIGQHSDQHEAQLAFNSVSSVNEQKVANTYYTQHTQINGHEVDYQSKAHSEQVQLNVAGGHLNLDKIAESDTHEFSAIAKNIEDHSKIGAHQATLQASDSLERGADAVTSADKSVFVGTKHLVDHGLTQVREADTPPVDTSSSPSEEPKQTEPSVIMQGEDLQTAQDSHVEAGQSAVLYKGDRITEHNQTTADTVFNIATETLATGADSSQTAKTVVNEGKTVDTAGAINTDTLVHKSEHMDQQDAEDVVNCTGKHGNVHINQSLYVETKDAITLNRAANHDYSVSIVASQITNNADQTSNGSFSLEATEGDVVNNHKAIKAAKSANLKAKGNVINDHGLIAGQTTNIDAGNNAINQAGTIASSIHTQINAGNNVENRCDEHSSNDKYGQHKSWTSGNIMGGNGEGEFKGEGLGIHAHNKVLNDGSEMLSQGGNNIAGDHGVDSNDRAHSYTSYDGEGSGSGISKLFHREFKHDEDIEKQEAEIRSIGGGNVISSSEGSVNSLGTHFIAGGGLTEIHARGGDAKLLEINMATRHSTHTEYLCGITSTDSESIQNSGIPTVLAARDGIIVDAKNNIIGQDAVFVTPGKVELDAKNVCLSREIFNNTSSGSSYDANVNLPLCPLPTVAALYECVQNLINSKDGVGVALNTWNATITSANALNSLIASLRQDSPLRALFNSTGSNLVALNLNHNQTKTNYQTTGSGGIYANELVINAEEKAELDNGYSVHVKHAEIYANEFVQEGAELISNTESKSEGISVSMGVSGKPNVGVSYSESGSSQTTHQLQEFETDDLEVNANKWTLHNAEMKVNHHLGGHVDQLNIQSDTDNSESHSLGGQVDTAGNVDYEHGHHRSAQISQPSGIHTGSSDLQVGALNTTGGQFKVDGQNNTTIGQTTSRSVNEYDEGSSLNVCGNPEDLARSATGNDWGPAIPTVKTSWSNDNQQRRQDSVLTGAQDQQGLVGSGDGRTVTREANTAREAIVPVIVNGDGFREMKDNLEWAQKAGNFHGGHDPEQPTPVGGSYAANHPNAAEPKADATHPTLVEEKTSNEHQYLQDPDRVEYYSLEFFGTPSFPSLREQLSNMEPMSDEEIMRVRSTRGYPFESSIPGKSRWEEPDFPQEEKKADVDSAPSSTTKVLIDKFNSYNTQDTRPLSPQNEMKMPKPIVISPGASGKVDTTMVQEKAVESVQPELWLLGSFDIAKLGYAVGKEALVPGARGLLDRLGMWKTDPFTSITEDVAGTEARNHINLLRLERQLAEKEERSLFNEHGELREEIIADSRVIVEGRNLKNEELVAHLTRKGDKITDWDKYTTNLRHGSSGKFEIHFYKNKFTNEVDYEMDFKKIYQDTGSSAYKLKPNFQYEPPKFNK